MAAEAEVTGVVVIILDVGAMADDEPPYLTDDSCSKLPPPPRFLRDSTERDCWMRCDAGGSGGWL